MRAKALFFCAYFLKTFKLKQYNPSNKWNKSNEAETIKQNRIITLSATKKYINAFTNAKQKEYSIFFLRLISLESLYKYFKHPTKSILNSLPFFMLPQLRFG
jgi:hypothetical protein